MSEAEQLRAQVAALTQQVQSLVQRQQAAEQRRAETAAATAQNGTGGVDATVRAVMEQQSAMLAQMMQQQTEALRAGSYGARSIIDVKAVGKPHTFKSQESEFRSWSVKFAGFVSGIWQKAKMVLEWAGDSDEPIEEQDLTDKWVDELDEETQFDGIYDFNRQLQAALLGLTEGEALDIVVSAEEMGGVESWRRLVRRFDPTSAGRSRNLMRQILNPGTYKAHELMAGLEKWEERIRLYQKRKNALGVRPTVPEDIRMGILQGMGPP